MYRTWYHIGRSNDDAQWIVRVDGDHVPVAFAARDDAIAAALDVARIKWEVAGEPTAVAFPVGDGGNDVRLFGGACLDEEEE